MYNNSKFFNNFYFGFLFAIVFLSSINFNLISFQNTMESNIPSNSEKSKASNISPFNKNLPQNPQINNYEDKKSSVKPSNIRSWKSILEKSNIDFNEERDIDRDVRVYGNSVHMVIGFNPEDLNASYKFKEEFGPLYEITDKIPQINCLAIKVPFYDLNSFMLKCADKSYIKYLEPNNIVTINGVPNDPSWPLQYGPRAVGVENAWGIETGDPSSVIVAIIDTGIDYAHPDLRNQYVALGWDWVSNDSDPVDDYGHGTHCAGIIAATINNSIGIAGIANVKVMTEKFLDSWGYGGFFEAAQGIIHAVDVGADILSNSWGSSVDSEVVKAAMKYAYEKGVIIIASAGNSASSSPKYPASYPEVISVSATDSLNNLASFSSFGPTVDIAAPGVEIYSTLPSYSGFYGFASGTSMAGPHVAAVAALIKSHYPSWSAERIRDRLYESALDLGAPGWDQYFGYGLVNAYDTLAPSVPHNLKLKVDAPAVLNVNESVIANVSIFNFGLNNEYNVELKIWLNESLIVNHNFSEILINEFTLYQLNLTSSSYGQFNLTTYITPIPDETKINDNRISYVIKIPSPMKRIGFIYAHQDKYMPLLKDFYEDLGYCVDEIFENLTQKIVERYKYLYICEWGLNWTVNELDVMEDFVNSGGTFVCVGDEPSLSVEELAQKWGITIFFDYYYYYGDTANINQTHPVMYDTYNIYISSLFQSLNLTSNVDILFKDNNNHTAIGVAVDVGLGHFCFLADDFYAYIDQSDNSIMFSNILKWKHQEHDLSVSLKVDKIVLNELNYINSTVINKGSNTENNVEFYLWLNSSLVCNVIFTNFTACSQEEIHLIWLPTKSGYYNITAYIKPVQNESTIDNNLVILSKYIFDLENYYMYSKVDYNWLDVSDGALYSLTDDTSFVIKLPFTFHFYDSAFETLYIGDNGWMSFENTDPRYYNPGYYYFPNEMPAFYYSIAPYFSDLYPKNNIYVKNLTNPNRVVIMYKDMDYYFGESAGSFELVLYENGEILFQYDDIDLSHYSPLIGLNYGYDLIHYNMFTEIDKLTDNYAILFTTNKPEHEISLSFFAPKYFSKGQTCNLETIIMNSGSNTEVNLTYKIYINNSLLTTPQSISSIDADEYIIINYPWVPEQCAIYNITVLISTVTNEKWIENNKETILLEVYKESNRIGLIYCHGESIFSGLKEFYENLGYQVIEINDILNSDILNTFSILFVNDYGGYWLLSEISAIENFIKNGGILVSVAHEPSYGIIDIAEKYGIGFQYEYVSERGYSTNINQYHPMMRNISSIYITPFWYKLNVISPAEILIWNQDKKYIIGAAVDIEKGHLYVLSDNFDYDLITNKKLFENILDWTNYDHELSLQMIMSNYCIEDHITYFNISVYNLGLNDENNIELKVYLNNTIIATYKTTTLKSKTYITYNCQWLSTKPGPYNLTIILKPVANEEITDNNKITKSLNVLAINQGFVGILSASSEEIPNYYYGYWFNDEYLPLYTKLTELGIPTIIITNEDIAEGILATIDVLILTSIVPSIAVSDIVIDWYNKGGDIISFSFSINFLCWAGILPKESKGVNGFETYWSYDYYQFGRVINNTHPIFDSFYNGQLVASYSFYPIVLQNNQMKYTSAISFYTNYIQSITDTNFEYFAIYEPKDSGRVVQVFYIIPYYDVDESSYLYYINKITLDTINWLIDTKPKITIEVIEPKPSTILSGKVYISWLGSDPQSDDLSYSIYYCIDDVWIKIVDNLTATSYDLKTNNLINGKTRIRIIATDGLFLGYDTIDDIKIKNFKLSYIIPIIGALILIGITINIYLKNKKIKPE